ncbi:MAG: UvrD-helicase domain-containing protein, partial [Bdellovibrionales bacterium]|nr:UvrD-helicase domain-containing protein [Bdellovibrionales bacterium]
MSSSSFQLVSEIVRAGAGAGKTTTLTKQVLQVAFEFYHRHQSFPRMVVTTFSRKATQELSERLVVEGIKTDRPDFLDYVSSRASIQISTIHGVLSLFLRRYGHLLDLDSGFRLLSESDAHLMAKGLLREILIDSPRHLDLLETWAVKDLIEMLRFYHCAVLANRDIQVASLETNFSLMGLYFGPEVSQLLKDIKQARSETEVESWKEYFTRLEEILVQIGKLSQSKGWTELDQMISRLGRKPSFSTKKVPEAFSPELRHRIEQLWKKIGDKLKKRGVRFESWETIRIQSLAFQDLAESFHSLFLEKKEKLGLIEMGDLELMTLEKLRQHPEVGEAFARDWDYWLIDEFQDTSPVQVELLKLLMGDRQSFLVGDPQQSIYLFRGARSEVFEEKWQDVKRQGGKQMEKRTNYRSNPPLLHFINQVFAQIGDQFSPMEPKKSEGECSREVAVFAEAKYFVHQEEEVQTEMAAIVHHIQRLVDRGVSFENICILGRTNRHLEEVARYLRKQAYPVHVHAASGFYRRREVVDGLSLVRFLLNPRDNVNLIALLRSPFFRVSDQELAEWLGSKPLSLWDYLQREKVVHSSLVQLSNYLEEVDRIGLSETLRKMVLNEGIMDFSLHYDATGRREANIWKFLLHLERTAR